MIHYFEKKPLNLHKNNQNAKMTLCERGMDVIFVLRSCHGRIRDARSRNSRDMVMSENGNDVTRTLQRRTKVAAKT